MKPLRILFFSDNFPPEVNAPANRTFEHCIEWVKNGVDVTVITCNPNFPNGKLYDGHKNRLVRRQVIHGVKVVRVWTFISSNRGTLKRILDYLSFAFTSLIASLFIKTDIIIATSPQLFAALGGYLAALIKRKPWVMEVRDLWPESIHALGAINNKSILNVLYKLVGYLYKQASSIIVVTDSFKSKISEEGINPDKIYVIKNGVNLERFKIRPKDDILLEELNLKNKFVAGYIGTHGMAHGLYMILEAASCVKNLSIHFLLIGDGAHKARLLKLKEDLGLTNVTMLSSIDRNKVGKYISIIDVALVPLKKAETFKTVIPSKIFENAAMGKPILLGVEGESKKLVEKYFAGLSYEPENLEDFLSKLNSLQNDQDLYDNCVAGCSQLVTDFERQKLARKMLGLIKEVMAKYKKQPGK